MQLSRRDFLKLGGVTAAGVLVHEIAGADNIFAADVGSSIVKKRIGETISICAYCAGGCGILIATESGRLIGIEGYPDHPINQGSLCSKAQSLYQIRTVNGKDNPRRLTKIRYRAPNSTAWEERSWDWALTEIAKRVKKTRDENWIPEDKNGIQVNRTEAIALLGGSAHDDEECYALIKMNRALGLVYTETQARI